MSNNPVPMLTVDKPEFEETQESQRDNNILIDVLAELQGNFLVIFFYENIFYFRNLNLYRILIHIFRDIR